MFSTILFRRRAGWQRLPALERGYPLVPALYLLVSAAMVGYGLIWQPLLQPAGHALRPRHLLVPVSKAETVAMLAAGAVSFK